MPHFCQKVNHAATLGNHLLMLFSIYSAVADASLSRALLFLENPTLVNGLFCRIFGHSIDRSLVLSHQLSFLMGSRIRETRRPSAIDLSLALINGALALRAALCPHVAESARSRSHRHSAIEPSSTCRSRRYPLQQIQPRPASSRHPA